MSCSRVCPVEVLCVGKCVYNDMHMQPINIGKLQRYATDKAFEEGWQFFEAGKDTGKSVGLVGGGPASLACAHELRRFGHKATIYEKRSVLGGLNTTGVAPYKMKADRSVEEIEWILGIGGIDVKTGVERRRGRVLGGAREEARRALLRRRPRRRHDDDDSGRGARRTSHGAVDWIEKMKTGRVSVEGMKHAWSSAAATPRSTPSAKRAASASNA